MDQGQIENERRGAKQRDKVASIVYSGLVRFFKLGLNESFVV